ncbi:MAG: hypothetical protein DWQ04_00970 [Chloroflexi bacterium]|nr:MAG: hypothetical protein DWQ04_00970 [Chloroflexota bacterium]
MHKSTEYAYFLNFPRRDLVFKFNRRALLQTISMEYKVVEGKARGGKGYKLPQLGSLSNKQMAYLIPHIIPGSQINTRDGSVWGQLQDSSQPKRLFLIEPATLFAFNLMNGRNTLHNISLSLAEEMQWSQEQAFAFTRGLFLHLVQLRFCVPQG